MQALWMLAAAFFFATMAVCVKFASEYFNSAELVFYRGLLGMFFMWALARTRGVTLATRFPGMHMWRSLVGVISLGAWFYAIAHLPLATAMTLNYMSSVWIAAFLVGGALLMGLLPARGQTPTASVASQGPLVLTVITGFIGVVMMLRPTIEQNQAFAGLIGLMSGLLAAFAYMQVMALARVGEPETRTVFYFAVGSAAAGGAGMLVAGVSEWHWKPALPSMTTRLPRMLVPLKSSTSSDQEPTMRVCPTTPRVSITSPSNTTRPLLAGCTPPMRRSNVVLPQPDPPSTDVTLPRWKRRLTSFRMVRLLS